MTEREVAMRIVVVDPPPDVAFALQRGRAELVAATRSTGSPLAFTFSVRARMGGPKPGVNLLGPFAQGTPDKRFVYVNSGTFAGDATSCWSRRAKVSLAGVTGTRASRGARSDACLEATIPGRAGDGGPSCATVPLLRGWEVATLHD